MDTSLIALTDALKQLFTNLKPNRKTFSFLLLIGKSDQGKSALLRQSTLEHLFVSAERSSDIYYNQEGIILELSETWIQQSNALFEQILRQINRCHYALRITGILFAIDVNPLFAAKPQDVAKLTSQHTEYLQRFSKSLGNHVSVALIFTKLDGIAGFADYFQQDSRIEQKKPLGFSIEWGKQDGKLGNNYSARFNSLLEVLSQDVISKVHPARSSLKRMLIREFPLQLAKLHPIIKTLLKQISPRHIKICAIYFMSSEQGGVSQDYLNEKICHEYALTLPNQIPQSSNFRAYFIDAALAQFQAETQCPIPKPVLPQKYLTKVAASVVGVTLAWILHHHIASVRILDDVTKELLAFDTERALHPHNNDALFHLSKASDELSKIKHHLLSPPTLEHLQYTLASNTNKQLENDFLPHLINTIEFVLKRPDVSPKARYDALKTYIALGNPQKRNTQEILAWFEAEAHQNNTIDNLKNQQELLQKSILTPQKAIKINEQLVRDTRNYLNALPAGYLYYALLKADFPQASEPLKWEGFSLGATSVPIYFTKQTFDIIQAQIPEKARHFQSENWVLERQDLSQLSHLLEQAYAYDYLTWWKGFLKGTAPIPAQNYMEARERLAALDNSDALRSLTHFIQEQTRPDLEQSDSVFNKTVANYFTSLHLISEATLKDISLDIRELKQFLGTLAIVHDNGRTAFNITKARFQNTGARNALSSFYLTTKQLPEPIELWAKQIADDAWFLLLSDAKQFINRQWQTLVLPDYQRTVLNHYPFDSQSSQDIALHDFDHFFATNGVLNHFLNEYIKPFLDTSRPEWTLREADDHVLPISDKMIRQFVRANVITAMFFPRGSESSQVHFSLQKMNLDPVISKLELTIGNTRLKDTQTNEAMVEFEWPESGAELILHSIEGEQYELSEKGSWAFFKLLDKLNVLMDKKDSSKLHVLFEVNGDSGRYLLKTANGLNPFTPGILSDFSLTEEVV